MIFLPFHHKGLFRSGLILFPILSIRPLSTSRPLLAENKYDIGGVATSVADVKAMKPVDRTIAHWLILVDWDLWFQRPFVIIDPMDPTGLLYLTPHEYTIHSRTLARSGISITVIARPGSRPPEPIKTAPSFLSDVMSATFSFHPLGHAGPGHRPGHTAKFAYDRIERGSGLGFTMEGASDWSTGFVRLPWKDFADLRKYLHKIIPWGEGQTVKATDGNIVAIMALWARELLHYLNFKSPGGRIGQLMPFFEHLRILLRHNGPAFTIQRLKICLFVLNSYAGGRPLTDTSALGQRIRLRGGLPLFMHRALRASIRDGVHSTIRLWASLFNAYKALWGPHDKSPLQSIQAPAFNGGIGDFSSFVGRPDGFFGRWADHTGKAFPAWEYRSWFGMLISSAGANQGQAMFSIYWDALAWASHKRNYILEWFQHWGDDRMARFQNLMEQEGSLWNQARQSWEDMPHFHKIRPLFKERPKGPRLLDGGLWALIRRAVVMDEDGDIEDTIWRMSNEQADKLKTLLGKYARKDQLPLFNQHAEFQSLEHWVETFRSVGLHPTKMAWRTPLLGRLHSIPEAAGKVRVVAIGDYFSQVGLKALHEYLFSLLRLNPNDATFDQQSAVDQFANKGYMNLFSYDLKSATDLIPAQLYKEVLEPLIGRKGADLWYSIMCDRSWLSPKDIRKEVEYVKYTRGQPMGLLSSWAGLAMVHHSLVQFAASRVGWDKWFDHYLVLGDDIILADSAVADEYLRVCEEFGIQVGIAKSLVSEKGLGNFASQTFLGNQNVSPISFKEELRALNWERRSELARRITHRYDGTEATDNSLLRRFVTSSQWAHLQGELTGKVGTLRTRFLDLLLRNPFAGKAEGIHIDQVFDWLGKMMPRLTVVESSKEVFGEAFRIILFGWLESECQTLARQWKEAHASIQRLAGGGPNNDWENNHLWRYLQDSLLDRIERFGKDLDSISLALKKVHSDYTPSLAQLLSWYVELSNIPPPMRDFGELRANMPAVLTSITTEAADEKKRGELVRAPIPRDNLKAPLQPLVTMVAKVLGLRLPLYALVGRSAPRTFVESLNETMREYEASRIKECASAVLNTRALVKPVITLPPMTLSNLRTTSLVLQESVWDSPPTVSSQLPAGLIAISRVSGPGEGSLGSAGTLPTGPNVAQQLAQMLREGKISPSDIFDPED